MNLNKKSVFCIEFELSYVCLAKQKRFFIFPLYVKPRFFKRRVKDPNLELIGFHTDFKSFLKFGYVLNAKTVRDMDYNSPYKSPPYINGKCVIKDITITILILTKNKIIFNKTILLEEGNRFSIYARFNGQKTEHYCEIQSDSPQIFVKNPLKLTEALEKRKQLSWGDVYTSQNLEK